MTYTKIIQLHEQGFSQRSISRSLGVSRNTVKKYLTKDNDEMLTWLASTRTRKQKLEMHQGLILGWLKKYPDLSASQIHDWLEERGFTEISPSTLRRYVAHLREEHQLPKKVFKREYEAIPDPPMGEQAQIDFGQTWVNRRDGTRIKLYVVAFVLSHSRYKYMEWWDKPYTAREVIQAHENAFRYFGGKPKTIVYDQDRALFVKENYGDILFTQDFEAYRQTAHFQVHACRPYDPESKGRIENVIGFIKKNFSKNRTYTDLETWNHEAKNWLKRKGNGKQHNTTKKVPALVFQEERRTLTPLRELLTPSYSQDEIVRQVSKDNTIKYKGNRYTVPRGTYSQTKEVYLHETEKCIFIVHKETGEILADHEITTQKGILIQKRAHLRDRSLKVKGLLKEASKKFSDVTLAEHYFEAIHKAYPRYTRDQVQLILDLHPSHTQELMDDALNYCSKHHLVSAIEFRDALNFLKTASPPFETERKKEGLPVLSKETQSKLKGIQIEARDLSVFTEMLGGASYE